MNIEGSGELEDGTRYSRELHIIETVERQDFRTVTREVTEETMDIGGEVCKVKVVRVDGEMEDENVEDASVRDHREFERRWDEVNWRMARVLEFHIPGVSSNQNRDGSSGSSRSGSGFFG